MSEEALTARAQLEASLEKLLNGRRDLLLKIDSTGHGSSGVYIERLFEIQKLIEITEMAIKREPSDGGWLKNI